MHQILNTFIDSAPAMGVLQRLLYNLHTNFKKTVSSKKALTRLNG